MSGTWPYRIAAVGLLLSTIAVDIVAKLGPLGDWSAPVDVAVNTLLLTGTVIIVVIGERKDKDAEETRLDDDY